MISVSQNSAKNQDRDQPFDGGVGLKEHFSARRHAKGRLDGTLPRQSEHL
jgi:hypothetical protein